MTYRFPSPGYAKRFARNARSRGYVVMVKDRTATVDLVDRQLLVLVQRYAGLNVKTGDSHQ